MLHHGSAELMAGSMPFGNLWDPAHVRGKLPDPVEKQVCPGRPSMPVQYIGHTIGPVHTLSNDAQAWGIDALQREMPPLKALASFN